MDKFKAVIPAGQRNDFVVDLISREIEKYEDHLGNIAALVEKDEKLNREMADWDRLSLDGWDE